jgi:hypothetical protein
VNVVSGGWIGEETEFSKLHLVEIDVTQGKSTREEENMETT